MSESNGEHSGRIKPRVAADDEFGPLKRHANNLPVKKPQPITGLLKKALYGTRFAYLDRVTEELKTVDLPEGVTVRDVIMGVMIERAVHGDIHFVRELLNRVEGKVPARIAGADGKPLAVPITVVEVVAPVTVINQPQDRVIDVRESSGEL
ncbi:MAG TPA: hypothetical protein VNU68_22500 [Verrucomicrobiae bacterium]|nr:hypothetical protein [Verrucomicrobiae bacterium]